MEIQCVNEMCRKVEINNIHIQYTYTGTKQYTAYNLLPVCTVQYSMVQYYRYHTIQYCIYQFLPRLITLEVPSQMGRT
jgi:hypothetical protein